MALSNADHSLWEREQATLVELRKSRPELFATHRDTRRDVLEKIGITTPHTNLPTGYIRYSPLDFLVEEVDQNGNCIEIGVEPKAKPALNLEKGAVYADMVKIGFSTLDGVQRVADALGLRGEDVRYAGIKDAVAITAQRISIHQSSYEQVKNASIAGVILKNIEEGKGAVTIGGLQGNRFTLLIRTAQDFDTIAFSNRLSDIHHVGVVNYFGPQRFGSPRFLSHIFGKHLLRGDLQALMRVFLSEETPTEPRYRADFRARAKAVHGDWKAMRDIMQELPYSFRHELSALGALISASDEASGHEAAVHAVGQQAIMWVRAYGSYLANVKLSAWSLDPARMPETIPLIVAKEPETNAFYREELARDGTDRYFDRLRRFRFINISKNPVTTTRVFPVMRGVKRLPEGIAISFELPKSAYATTVLMHLFDTISGFPIPEWVRTEEVDTKKMLDLGTIAPVQQVFRRELDAAMAAKQQISEEVEG